MGVSAKACVRRSTKAIRRAARFLIMTRLARVIAVDVPHHVTQRGNARRFILDFDVDRMAYLNLWGEPGGNQDRRDVYVIIAVTFLR